jgi:hypothetical protein
MKIESVNCSSVKKDFTEISLMINHLTDRCQILKIIMNLLKWERSIRINAQSMLFQSMLIIKSYINKIPKI